MYYENPQPTHEHLTARERELLSLVNDGLSNREIADFLTLSINTVKSGLYAAYKKLGVNNRVRAVVKARQLDLL